jgi:SAM-dependent methyltransferase
MAVTPKISYRWYNGYEGFDPSIELIKLARQRPLALGTNFVQADALSYTYPANIDVIFGFASYLHLDKQDFAQAVSQAARSLRPEGILAITLKERDSYEAELVEDEFGKRQFYYYDEATVRELLNEHFEVVKIEHRTLKRKTARWLIVYAKRK